jgi:hypothetical protein
MGEPTYPTGCVSCCLSNPNGQILTELRDHGNLLAGVDSKARPIERRVTHAVRVEVAAGLVTSALSAEPVSACERSTGEFRTSLATNRRFQCKYFVQGWLESKLTKFVVEITGGHTARVRGVRRGNLGGS